MRMDLSKQKRRVRMASGLSCSSARTCKYVPRFSILVSILTNIGDIRSESVHDINKIRAWHTRERTKPRHRCTYFTGCILFIPSGIHGHGIFFCVLVQKYSKYLGFDQSNFTILQICLQFCGSISLSKKRNSLHIDFSI